MARSLRRANEKKAYERALKLGLDSLRAVPGPQRQALAQRLGPALAAIAPESRGEVRRPGDVAQMLYIHIWLHPDEPQRWEDLDQGILKALRSVLGEAAPLLTDAFFDERMLTVDFCTTVDGQLLTARIDVERTARDREDDPRFGTPRLEPERPPRRPYGERPYGDRPSGNRPGNDRPYQDRPYSDRPRGPRPGGDRPGGDRPYGNRPGSNRPGSNRPGSDRPPFRRRDDRD